MKILHPQKRDADPNWPWSIVEGFEAYKGMAQPPLNLGFFLCFYVWSCSGSRCQLLPGKAARFEPAAVLHLMKKRQSWEIKTGLSEMFGKQKLHPMVQKYHVPISPQLSIAITWGKSRKSQNLGLEAASWAPLAPSLLSGSMTSSLSSRKKVKISQWTGAKVWPKIHASQTLWWSPWRDSMQEAGSHLAGPLCVLGGSQTNLETTKLLRNLAHNGIDWGCCFFSHAWGAWSAETTEEKQIRSRWLKTQNHRCKMASGTCVANPRPHPTALSRALRRASPERLSFGCRSGYRSGQLPRNRECTNQSDTFSCCVLLSPLQDSQEWFPQLRFCCEHGHSSKGINKNHLRDEGLVLSFNGNVTKKQ